VAAPEDFHARPFDDGTLTKLHILELYARAWLPVFLANAQPKFSEIHVFDFFAGPGSDAVGVAGSPMRILRQLNDVRSLPGWPGVTVHAHFYDASAKKIDALHLKLVEQPDLTEGIRLDLQSLDFEVAFERSRPILRNRKAAKLLVIDQCGVSHVTQEVFEILVSAPACDFLFFISSSTLNRFREHTAIKQKIERPDDSYHVHRAATDYYRSLLPESHSYFLAPFSIKKGANIYGLIFGSGHPLGMAKFLEVAWSEDEINGEADFNIHRDRLVPGQSPLFPYTKVAAFEDDLERHLRSGAIRNEREVIELCFEHGVRPQHAEPVLKRLKQEGVIRLGFRVPQVKHFWQPRPITIESGH
jgi:three-Cys-motif partner protein